MEGQEPLGWEQLVTDGHVRAARVRRVQPVLLLLGLLLVIVGWWLLTSIEAAETQSNRDEALGAAVERHQDAAIDAFANMPAPQVRQSRIAAIPQDDRLSDLQEQILTALDRDGNLPSGLAGGLAIEVVDPPKFWRERWPTGEAIATGSRGIRLVGLIVNTGSERYPDLERWLGVFRRTEDAWESVSISAPDFVGPPNVPKVAIERIPVTLRPVLETEA